MASPSNGEIGTGASPESGAGLSRYESVVQGVAGVVAPVTLLSAIAVYFVWARISAFDEYFGLNPATVGYSTRDYVLNSLDPLFLPVLIVRVCLIGLGLAHALVKQVHQNGDRASDLRRLATEPSWWAPCCLRSGRSPS